MRKQVSKFLGTNWDKAIQIFIGGGFLILYFQIQLENERKAFELAYNIQEDLGKDIEIINKATNYWPSKYLKEHVEVFNTDFEDGELFFSLKRYLLKIEDISIAVEENLLDRDIICNHLDTTIKQAIYFNTILSENPSWECKIGQHLTYMKKINKECNERDWQKICFIELNSR